MEATSTPKTPQEIAKHILPAALELGHNVMQFAKIMRGTGDLNGNPESDADHTVMLGFLAMALAEYDPRLDIPTVAVNVFVHDWPEVYAGDVQTTHYGQYDRQAKEADEAAAVTKLDEEFSAIFPGLIQRLKTYEAQEGLNETFVRTLDKNLPAITHLFNNCVRVLDQFDTVEEVRENSRKHLEHLEQTYGGDHPLVLSLRRMVSEKFAEVFEKEKARKNMIDAKKRLPKMAARPVLKKIGVQVL